MKRLSDAQISTLKELDRFPITAGPKEPCLSALKRRGLATHNSNAGVTYGRPMWHITDAGRAALASPVEGGRK